MLSTLFGKKELVQDKDREFLLQGIQNGFRIIASSCNISPVKQRNHKPAEQHSAAVEKELLDEMNKGHYVIDLACKEPTAVSALAATPKDDTSVMSFVSHIECEHDNMIFFSSWQKTLFGSGRDLLTMCHLTSVHITDKRISVAVL